MGKTKILDKTATGKTTERGNPEERPTGIPPRSSDIGRREKIIIFNIGFIRFLIGGERTRTADLLRARQVLYQMSYAPTKKMGLSGIEPLTSRLSGERSNRLSYRPTMSVNIQEAP